MDSKKDYVRKTVDGVSRDRRNCCGFQKREHGTLTRDSNRYPKKNYRDPKKGSQKELADFLSSR